MNSEVLVVVGLVGTPIKQMSILWPQKDGAAVHLLLLLLPWALYVLHLVQLVGLRLRLSLSLLLSMVRGLLLLLLHLHQVSGGKWQ